MWSEKELEREKKKKKKLFGKEKDKKKKEEKKKVFLLIYIKYGPYKIWGLFQFRGLKPLLKWLKGWTGPDY